MSKLKKMAAAAVVLATLAVGGAAFAQAQNASTATTTITQRGVGEPTASSGATDGVRSDVGQPGETDDRDSASGQDEAPDSGSEMDAPDGPGGPVDANDEEAQD